MSSRARNEKNLRWDWSLDRPADGEGWKDEAFFDRRGSRSRILARGRVCRDLRRRVPMWAWCAC